MRTLKALFVLFAFALTACGTDAGSLTTLDEVLGEGVDDVAAAIAAAQEDLAEVGEEIQESEASEDLQAAWSDLQADLTSFFSSLQTDGTVDTTQVQQIMDDFEQQLEAAGDQISPEVREAWNTLRAQIEQLIQQAG